MHESEVKECRENQSDHVLTPDVPNLQKEDSVRNMNVKRTNAMKNLSVTPKPNEGMAELGNASVTDTQHSIRFVRCV